MSAKETTQKYSDLGPVEAKQEKWKVWEDWAKVPRVRDVLASRTSLTLGALGRSFPDFPTAHILLV